MPFTDPFTLTTPADTDLVSQGDDRIRELKRALNERLTQIITGWPDTDPLKLKASSLDTGVTSGATIATGTAAALPGVPATTFYWATDTNNLYFNESGTWVLVVQPAATIADLLFSQMKRVNCLFVGTHTAITGGSVATAFTHSFGHSTMTDAGITEATLEKWMVASFRFQGRLTSQQYRKHWGYHTSIGHPTSGTAAYGFKIPEDYSNPASLEYVSLVIRTVDMNYGISAAGEVNVRVSGFLFNEAPSARDVEIQLQAYLWQINA